MARIPFHIGRNSSRFVLPAILLALLAALLNGCSTNLNRNTAASRPPLIRVRLLLGQEQLTIIASQPPVYRTESDPTPHLLALPRNSPVVITLTAGGWRIGATILGSGVLTIQPAVEGSVAIAPMPTAADKQPTARTYRGDFRLVPVPQSKFDVINQVDIEGYLAGVLPRELPRGWHEETYKAQAIVARTYALYEKGYGTGRYWDVFSDERSQVYGGMIDETDKSRSAVNQTQGVVVAFGSEGQERIFKAYYSSCCGGISQDASEVFGESPNGPMPAQNNHAACNASPRFNWGPVVISKVELTRRIQAWGIAKKKAVKDIGPIKEVALQSLNLFGRPTRFSITDAKGFLYSLPAEEFRGACNWDSDKTTPPAKLFSSFVKVITDTDSIRFVEGHGLGHGVGLCQWCSENYADQGWHDVDIIMAAYPHAVLVKAY